MTESKPRMSAREMFESKAAAFVIGLAVLVVAAAAVAFAYNAVNGNPLAHRKTVLAAFSNVNGLLPGDDVRIASSRVGYVEEIRTIEGGGAIAVLKLDDPTIRVYRNASTSPAAALSSRSTLGQKFVDLKLGTPSAGELGPDEVIPQSNTRPAEELTDLFDLFDAPTRTATGVTLRELGGGAAGRSEDLNDFLGSAPTLLVNLATVSKSVTVKNGADLTRLMQSATNLASRFEGREREIADLTRQLGATLDGLAVDNGEAVRQTIAEAPETLRAARGALTALAPPLADTDRAVTSLRSGAVSLGSATPDLRGVFREGVPPLDDVPAVAEDGQPAVEELTDVAEKARPLTPRVKDAVERAATPLGVLAPFAPEIAGWFTNATAVLKDGDAAGNWLRFYLLPRSESVSGTVPLRDPTTSRNSYPAPGQAANDRASSPLIGGTR